MKFILVQKQLGPNWENDGTCTSNRKGKSCGPGMVRQIRSCTDGTFEECTLNDRERNSSCQDAGIKQPNCQRVLGNWTNIGNCTAVGAVENCGPGLISRNRTCEDGTILKCKDAKLKETVSCVDAGDPLPPCPKVLGNWKNDGPCQSINVGCGPGNVNQIRNCINGTDDKCSIDDIERRITCKAAGLIQPECTGK